MHMCGVELEGGGACVPLISPRAVNAGLPSLLSSHMQKVFMGLLPCKVSQ